MALMAVCFPGPKSVQAGGFQVKKVSGTSVVIKWSKDKNAVKYMLYRCMHKKAKNYSQQFKLLKTLKKNTTCYTDKKLKKNMYYDYKICMVDKEGKKACSNVKKTVFIKK